MILQVNFEVARWRLVAGVVEVWGYVGDYEVVVHLPAADKQAQLLLRKGEEGPLSQ